MSLDVHASCYRDTPIPVILVLNHGKIPCHGLPSDRVLEDMESWIEEHRVCSLTPVRAFQQHYS